MVLDVGDESHQHVEKVLALGNGETIVDTDRDNVPMQFSILASKPAPAAPTP